MEAGHLETGYTLRLALPADAPVIAAQRRAMFVDMGDVAYAALEGMDARFADWVSDRIARGVYIGWLVQAPSGEIVAGAGLDIREGAPLPGDFDTRRGYIMNVYVHPDHRRRGLARRMIEALLAWCQDSSLCGLSLHASDEGRPLYASLGFMPSNEMRLKLPPAPDRQRA
jgi:GNAT superfamily N-acetyltransferase